MTNEISQTDQILNYLQAGNVLTPLEALRKFNCLRLGARIYDLRQHGSISDLVKGVGTHIPNIHDGLRVNVYTHMAFFQYQKIYQGFSN